MPIETTCPGCGRKLQVAEVHAGKQARCPLCNEIYTVPSVSSVAATSDAAPSGAVPVSPTDGAPQPANSTASHDFPNEQWRMRTPEGQTYGPVTKAELDGWVAEGRISSDCMLSSDSNPDWRSADTVYSALVEVAKPQPATTGQSNQRYVTGHRGGLILGLGIASWIVGCPIFGLCAWVMGSADLREMQQGRMDSSGHGLTQAGQIVGMLHALLTIIVIVVFVFLLLLGVAWR